MKKRKVTGRSRGFRGEGSIEKRPSGKFQAIFPDGTDPETGKRVKIKRTFDTEGEAAAFLETMRANAAKMKGAGLQTTQRTTLGEWLQRWLEGLRGEVAAGELATHTLRPYEQHVKNILTPYLGRVILGDLKRWVIKEGLAKMRKGDEARKLGPVSSKMLAKARTTLGVALQAAVEDGVLAENPAHGLKRRRRNQGKAKPGAATAETARVQAFDEWQARRFLGFAQADRLHALYVLWLDSGAREGELFGLHWPEVDFERGTVAIVQSLEEDGASLELKAPKTEKSRRTLPVSPPTMSALAEHRKRMLAEGNYRPDGPVFCDTRGGFLRKDNMRNRSFRRIIGRANAAEGEGARPRRQLPMLRPYDLRHTCATLLLMRGVPVHVVAERLGHESPLMVLKTYGHVVEGMQKAAAEQIGAALWGGEEKAEAAG